MVLGKDSIKQAANDKVSNPASSSCLMMKPKSRMIFHSLLIAVFVLRCVAVSHDSANVLTYPGRVINTTTTQLGCPADAKIETVIAEVKQDIRSLLHQVGMLVHVQVQCIVQILLNNIYSYITIWSYIWHVKLCFYSAINFQIYC